MDAVFQVHRLTEEGLTQVTQLAEHFDDLLSEITNLAGDSSRELSIVRTKLEEACFYAKKAVANNPDMQESS